MVSERTATVDDLYHTPDNGKYELVDGRLVRMAPTGGRPAYIGTTIATLLKMYELETKRGYAFGDNAGFVVDALRQRSFSPDAAYAFHADIDSDDFIVGAPAFAVEVRSKNDHGPAADREYTAKRADYFAAGTQVVWDVNPRTSTVTKYTADAPDTPTIFRQSDLADAEPALPGWRVAMETLFRA